MLVSHHPFRPPPASLTRVAKVSCRAGWSPRIWEHDGTSFCVQTSLSDDLAAAYLGGGRGQETTLPGPSPDARESLPVSLSGADVRRLERLAAARGKAPDELAKELLQQAIGARQ